MSETRLPLAPRKIGTIFILGALNTITPFSIDMYLPAFPEIAKALHASVASVSLSVSTYFLGFALGQILYGPLLDRYGRKRPIYVGLTLYILSSVACVFSSGVQALWILRFTQAIGGSVASVACNAMVRDFFPAKESVKVFSLMTLILGTSPLLAPTLGGWVVTLFGWKLIFIILAIIVLCILAVVFFYLPEGHAPDPSVTLRPKPIIRNFLEILRTPQFSVYTLAGSFSFAGLFVYVAGSPSIFMDYFHVSTKTYGLIFAALAAGMIGGSQLNLALGQRFSKEDLFRSTLILQAVFAILFLIGVWNNAYGLAPTLFFLFVILLCSGVSYPNAAAIALEPFSQNAGRASSLLGFIQLGLGAVLSSGVGLLEMQGSLPTALVMAFSSTIGLFILLKGANFKKLHLTER